MQAVQCTGGRSVGFMEDSAVESLKRVRALYRVDGWTYTITLHCFHIENGGVGEWNLGQYTVTVVISEICCWGCLLEEKKTMQ